MSTYGQIIDFLVAGLETEAGVPLSGGKVYSYVAGTTTFKNTWTDRAKTILSSNPIILDTYGRAIIYGTGLYKFNIYDSNDNFIKTVPDYRAEGDVYWEDASDYASINAAVTAIGSTQTTLVVSDAQTLAGNIIFPTTLTLKVPKGGSIVKASTYTATINGPLEAGPYQVFSGFAAGNVTFGAGAVKEVYAEWWGAKGDGILDSSAAMNLAIASISGNGGKVRLGSGTFLWSNTASYATNTTRVPGIQIEGAGMYTTIIDNRVANGYAFSFNGRTEYLVATLKYQMGSGISNLAITTLAGTKPVVSSGIFFDCQYNFSIKNVMITELTGNGIVNTVYMNGVSSDYGPTIGVELNHIYIEACDGWGITNFGVLAATNYYDPVLVNAHDLNITACGQGGWRAILQGSTIQNCVFGTNGYYNASSLGSGILFDKGGGISLEVGVYENHFEGNQHYNVCVLEGQAIGFKRNRRVSFLGAVGTGPRMLNINSPTSEGVPNLADLVFGISGVSVNYVRYFNIENDVFLGASCSTYNAMRLGYSAYGKITNCQFESMHASSLKYSKTGDVFTDIIEDNNSWVAEDTDSDNTDILTITGSSGRHGMLIVKETTTGASAVFFIASTVITKVSGDALYTVTKDTAASYNVYYDTQFKVQNLVGNGKHIWVGFYGI